MLCGHDVEVKQNDLRTARISTDRHTEGYKLEKNESSKQQVRIESLQINNILDN